MSVKQVFNTSAELDYPTVLPTLDLDFANSKTLDPRITFTRASGGSYVGADGLIKLAGVNEARFDHDPVTGESLGLLVEEARTNLVTYSEDFSTAWIPSSFGEGLLGVVTTNQAIAPDGSLTADKIVLDLNNATTGSSRSSISNGGVVSTITGQPYVFSIWLKTVDGSSKRVRLSFEGQSGDIPGYTGDIGSIFDIDGTWRRYTVGIQSAIDTDRRPRISTRIGTGSSNYIEMYAWGAQFEQASFPTSYIPTEGSTRTRAADKCNISSSITTEFTNNSEMTMVSKVRSFCNVTQDNLAIGFNEGTSTVRGLLVNIQGTTLQTRIGSRSDIFGDVAYTNPNPIGIGDWATTALAFKSNVGYHCHFGERVVERPNINTTLFVLTNLFIGDRFFATNPLNGHINFIRFYPRRLPNAQLQTLTS